VEAPADRLATLTLPVGDTAHAECTPLHRGRSTMVWETRVTRGDGKLAAIVTQT
jgi:acyl-coenzyme A thioesterase PaaI-like protein